MFVVFKTEDGGSFPIHFPKVSVLTLRYICCVGFELVTPPLDGMILPGITRDSVLTLARNHISNIKRLPELSEKLVVSERPVTMKEVKEASQSGRLVELFGSGTCLLPASLKKVLLNVVLFKALLLLSALLTE